MRFFLSLTNIKNKTKPVLTLLLYLVSFAPGALALELPSITKKPFAAGDKLFACEAYSEAAQAYQVCVDQNPEDPKAHLRLGKSLARLGQEETALNEFFKTLFLNNSASKMPEENLEARSEISAIFLKRGDYDEAGGQLRQILALRPQDKEVRGNYALCLQNCGFLDAAIEQFNLLLRQEPKNVTALYNLGTVYLKKTDSQNAKTCFMKVVGMEPKNDLAFIGLARAYLLEKQVKQAIAVLTKIVERSPSNYFANLALADAYKQAGSEDIAIEYYRKAIALNPKDPASKAALLSIIEKSNTKSLVQNSKVEIK